MAEPITESGRDEAIVEKKWANYNLKMADLFRGRDQYPVDSPERTAMAERILALWYTEGA
jgi:hypothetical protein